MSTICTHLDQVQITHADKHVCEDAGRVVVKDRVNAIGLAPAEEFRRDFELFAEGLRNPKAQSRIQGAMKRGLQTRDAEIDLARMLGDLPDG